MRGGAEIDWRRLADGTLAYELPFAALDGERFERIARGFANHYDVEPLSPDSFAFERGEGYTRLQRWDAFGYVDRGQVTRIAADAAELPETPGVFVLPPGFRAIRFTLNMRVILVFWAVLMAGAWFFFFRQTHPLLWVLGFVGIYALHVRLVMRSLSDKLSKWMARESWN